MRSNIIQMLLNASSGKGGSSPGQPESEWTIVHFLTSKSKTSYFKCASFKTKSEDGGSKYYYVNNAYFLEPSGAYGFADLEDFRPFSENSKIVRTIDKTDSIDLTAVDPNGRPMMFALTSARCDDPGQGNTNHPPMIFSTNSTWKTYHYFSFQYYWTSEERDNPKLPGNPDISEYDLKALVTIGIKIPPKNLDSVTISISPSQDCAIIQDLTSTPEELVNSWKEMWKNTKSGFAPRVNYKTDFTNDRLMKLVKSSVPMFYSETDNFSLTLK